MAAAERDAVAEKESISKETAPSYGACAEVWPGSNSVTGLSRGFGTVSCMHRERQQAETGNNHCRSEGVRSTSASKQL